MGDSHVRGHEESRSDKAKESVSLKHNRVLTVV